MFGRQVPIPPRHRDRAVTQRTPDLGEGRPTGHQPGGTGLAQGRDAEIRDARLAALRGGIGADPCTAMASG